MTATKRTLGAIGPRILASRALRHMTRERLSWHCLMRGHYVSPNTIYRIESGLTPSPRLSTVEVLCQVLRIKSIR